jgi:ferric-chelate reductase (NADPH)
MTQPRSATTHYPRRARNALRFRKLTVMRTEQVAGHFQRIVAGGDELEGFESQGFDDHIKLFFPEPDSDFVPPIAGEDGIIWQNDVRPSARDYTPIYDPSTQELTVDFYIHDGGVASDWAVQAKPGDTLYMGGPRGSLIVPTEYHWQLYVCDESGMPALRRRLAELNARQFQGQVTALVSVHSQQACEYLTAEPGVNIEWFVGESPETVARHALALTIPEEDYFIWVTGEGKVAKQLGEQLSVGRDAQLVRTVAYWHDKR